MTVVGVDILVANTGYALTIPAGIAWITIQCRTAVDVRVGTTAALAATPTDPYAIIKSGTGSSFPITPRLEETTLWLAAASAVRVEVIY